MSYRLTHRLQAASSKQEARMDDTEPQTAAAKVLWHFTMPLDGFVAGPEHDMDWLTGGNFWRDGRSMRSTCTSRRFSSASASASTTTRLTTGSSSPGRRRRS